MGHVKLTRLERAFYRIEREQKLHDQEYRCKYCHCTLTRSTATTDHVIAACKIGYRHSSLNAVVSCGDCNTRKGRRTIEEFVSDPFQILITEITAIVEMRTLRAEYNLDVAATMSFNKWLFNKKYRVRGI